MFFIYLSHRNRPFDMRMGIVVFQCKVFVLKVEDGCSLWIYL
jgi:hypothetical protein